jgi:ATP-dependent Clp protease ATP-binding subunit ClpC
VFERFTQPARQVVVLAQQEAVGFGHNYLGTEHILLGLLRYEDGIPARVLRSYGVGVDEVRAQVSQIIGRGEGGAGGQIPFTPRAKKVLELSMREAKEMGHGYIGTEHILLGLLREGEGVAVRILAERASPAEIHAAVVRALSGESEGPSRQGPVLRPRRRTRVAFAPLVVGWLLFVTGLGVGTLIGWAIWG